MKKLIDFDGLFDEKLAEYIRDNPTKYTEKQWENVIPKLYRQFGDTYVAKAGATPRQYYSSMTDEELCDALARHVSEGVPVSDFLCREIERRGCTDALVRLLSLREEEILTLAVNLAGSSEKAYPAYFDLLISEVSADIKEAVCEQLKGGADAAKERAIACYEAGQEREIMLEILSRCKQRDDRVFDILMNAFRTGDEVPMHASYLAAYGDERALPVLLDYIDRDDINFLEFRELKYAIEALGGEYTKPRDFTNDPYYQEILEQSQLPPEPASGKTDA
ncbi:MAG TPA: hypothetical protein H9683_02745 [Firmicutes bacterium]|nr:hypothetical protein [Bacillota bacterium]